MRLITLLLALVAAFPAAAAEIRFEAWTSICADAQGGADCRLVAKGAASGAAEAALSVHREPPKDAPPRLTITLRSPDRTPPRPRLALAVDGGPPVRLAPGSDLASGPGAQAGDLDIRLSEAATKRLLPFLRRGKTLAISVSGDEGELATAELDLAGFGPAAADVDHRQGRADRQDALAVLIGAGGQPAESTQVRDVKRDTVPAPLRTAMTDRDCPVWDRTEQDPSFLADQSFAADLGGGRTLWAIVCTSGAYNVEFVLFVEDPSKAADRFEPLLFATFVESIGWTGVDSLSNVTYEPEKRRLKAFEKGRKAGDCGTVGLWEWAGAAFRMLEYRAKEECDGSGEPSKFPIVFRGEN
jgi:hypothetical protein